MERFIILLRILLSAFTIGISGYMLYIGKDGWGWFLFVGLWLGAVSYGDDSEKESHHQK
jgi:hypothetical protein